MKATHAVGTALAGALLALAFASPSLAIDPNNTHQGAATLPVPTAQLPTAPPNGEMGFVFSDFSPAILPGMKENCPTGWAMTNREAFLTTITPAERERLMKPENEPELSRLWKASVVLPDGRNVCTNYNQFPDRPQQTTVAGKFAYGLNLDGNADPAKDPYICSHEKFTSPSGEKGIDNQLYRAQGCNRQWRGPDGGFAEIVPGLRQEMARGEYSIVVLLRGVDNLVNDDHVEVVIATADDKPITDGTQNYIANASYTVSTHAEWRQVLQGKIVDGVLTTEPSDILLKRKETNFQKRPAGTEWDFQRGRLRLTFRPDGSLEGVLAGYQNPLFHMFEEIGGGRGTVTVAGIDCAAQYNAFMRLADGDRDPQTGKCRRISAAYNVIATPAYVFDRPPQNTKTADAR